MTFPLIIGTWVALAIFSGCLALGYLISNHNWHSAVFSLYFGRLAPSISGSNHQLFVDDMSGVRCASSTFIC